MSERHSKECSSRKSHQGTYLMPYEQGCARGGMADTPDLGSGSVRIGGSSPLARTTFYRIIPLGITMKLGRYRHQLNAGHYRFARQCGCTHQVIYLLDCFRPSPRKQPGDARISSTTAYN